MKDRIPLYPGRVKLTAVDGQPGVYDMVRADEATEQGTPLSKATLLDDDTAALYGLTGDNATVNNALAGVGKGVGDIAKVGDVRYSYRDSLGTNWALANADEFDSTEYPALAEVFPKDPTSNSSWPSNLTMISDFSNTWNNGNQPYILACPIGYLANIYTGSGWKPVYSSDGMTWHETNAPVNTTTGFDRIDEFTYIDGLYVMVGHRSNRSYYVYLMCTDNPITGNWTVVDTGLNENSARCKIRAGDGYYYIYSYSSSNSWVHIYRTTDINTWDASNVSSKSGYNYAESNGADCWVIPGKGLGFVYNTSSNSSATDGIYYAPKTGGNIVSLNAPSGGYTDLKKIIRGDDHKVYLCFRGGSSSDSSRENSLYAQDGTLVNSNLPALPDFYYKGEFITLNLNGTGYKWSDIAQNQYTTFELTKGYTAAHAITSWDGSDVLAFNDAGAQGLAKTQTYLPTIEMDSYGLKGFVKVKEA